MIAYKGFTPELTSRLGDGKKETCTFEPGCTMTSEESKTARTGYHCCENPAECLAYYSWDGKNRFWKVEAEGDIDEDAHERIACTKITLLEELTPIKFAANCMWYICEHPQRDRWQQDHRGVQIRKDRAEAMQEGYIAIARGEHPRVRGAAGSVLGLLVEKDGKIVMTKGIGLMQHNERYANKWLTVNEKKEVVVVEEEAD